MINRERIRYILMLVVVAICASIIVVVLFVDRTVVTTSDIEDVVMTADVTLNQLNYTETKNGVAQWNIIADSAAHDMAKGVTEVDNIRMRLFNQQQVGEVLLTAKTGTINLAKHYVVARGDVVLVTENGLSFVSDSVTFTGNSAESGIITTDDRVKIKSDQFELNGTGMSGDIAQGIFTLKNDVAAVYYPQQVNGGQ